MEQAKAFVEEAQQGARASNCDHPPPQQYGFRTLKLLWNEYTRRLAAWDFSFLREQKEEGELVEGPSASSWDGDHPPSQHINPTQDPPRQSQRDARHGEPSNLCVELSFLLYIHVDRLN